MPGTKGRSGPPNNQNARGNRGGRGRSKRRRGAPLGNRYAVGNKGGPGGPPGNKKAQMHGVVSYLRHGELPAEVAPIVEQFIVDLDAEITVRFDADDVPFEVQCLRETAISDYAVAQLRARWAGTAKDLTPHQRDHFLQGFLTALDQRDDKVKRIHERKRQDDRDYQDIFISEADGDDD